MGSPSIFTSQEFLLALLVLIYCIFSAEAASMCPDKLPLPKNGVVPCVEGATGVEINNKSFPACSRYVCTGSVYSRCVVNKPRGGGKDARKQPLDKGFCILGFTPDRTMCKLLTKVGSAYFVSKVFADKTTGILRKNEKGACELCSCKSGQFVGCTPGKGCAL